MKKLIFDIAITGHHSEYIGHLVDYLYDKNAFEFKYNFVIHPAFANTFPKIFNKANKIENVEWSPISNDELLQIESKNGVLASIITMKIMDNYAKKYSADEVIVMDFHPIKYGSLFYTPPYKMSSILFLLFHRLEKKTWKEKLEYFKRYYITKWSSANKKLEKIFILNDSDAVAFMNKEFKTNCFKMLPDPIPKLKPLENFNIYEYYEIGQERNIFLHIGALGDRKGTRDVIEAAKYLSKASQKKVAILLAGKASKVEEEELYLRLIETLKKNTDVQIIWENQFVPNQMMKSLFDQCDTVLLPYKNAEFSSGILGHAAAANKRVIATNAGLIRELVNTYQLGELLDEPTAEQLAKKITKLLHENFEAEGQNKFVNEHSPKAFAGLILNS